MYPLSLPEKSRETVIHAFITSRLDYCNSLLYGISKSQVARLQLVQNAAAKFLKNGRKFDHVTPILRALHWLPVHFRIEFKILLFVFKCLNNLAPNYLSDLLCPYNPSRSLRSSYLNLLTIPCSRLKRRGTEPFWWWALDCGTVCLYNLEWPPLYQFSKLSLKLICFP